jgi:hypothetical protein
MRAIPCRECGNRHEVANLAEAEGHALIPADTYDCPDTRTYVFHRRHGGTEALRGASPGDALDRAGYGPDGRYARDVFDRYWLAYEPPVMRGPGGYPAVLAPRATAMRILAGGHVTEAEFVTDSSEYGVWHDGGPLERRPPEFWVDQVHDACGADW